MPKAASPYRENGAWAMRRRIGGRDYFVHGYATKTEARAAMEARIEGADIGSKGAHRGPATTTVAQALQDYAVERLPFLKGAPQLARRLNSWLREAGLGEVVVAPLRARPSEPTDEKTSRRSAQHYEVTVGEPGAARRIPRGLAKHRAELQSRTARSRKLRERLATLPMAEVTRHEVQAFIDTLLKEGAEPASVKLEQALLRVVFNHARFGWQWAGVADNPAVGLRTPKVDNARTRVLSQEEEARLQQALRSSKNPLLALAVTLYVESAMRASEPLQHACWSDVDWDAQILRLQDGKDGRREVPLTHRALDALQQLKAVTGGQPNDPVLRLTYDQLAAGFRRARERAGLPGLRLHDLRHTSATRTALDTGNIFLVKALTGHKTQAMLERYVNVSARDVVAYWKSKEGRAPNST